MSAKERSQRRSGKHPVPVPQQVSECDARIVALNDEEAMQRLAGELAEHGVGLRIMPLKLAPEHVRKGAQGPQVWVAADEPDVVRLGVTARTTLAEALLAGGRALAAVLEFPTPEEDPEAGILIEAFAASQAQSLIGHEFAHAQLRNLMRRAARARLSKERISKRIADAAWPLLSVLSLSDRDQVRERLERVDSGIGGRLDELERRFGVRGPATAHEARQMLGSA